MAHDAAYHWPPELMALLTDTIPLLCRSKDDVVNFLRGAGTNEALLGRFRQQLAVDRSAVSKYEIAREVIRQLNEQGDQSLGVRRALLRRVTEFEDFSTCWPDDQLKARGLVGQIRQVVGVKDSFTRMQQERDREREAHLADRRAAEDERRRRSALYSDLRAQIAALFSMGDAQKRGLELEALLNRVFALDGIGVRESFTLWLEDGEAAEQIDGVVELDGQTFLVEVKWWAKPLDVNPVSRHLVRLMGRPDVSGLMISASGYSAPAVAECERFLTHKVMVLGELRELVLLLEREKSVADWLREKTRRAKLDRRPYTVLDVDF
ncbi:restriction endonuclease [Kitasatospora sp. NPDC101157]|uniref:restriction endonuclease n=1 Tax=Kitasatospora sp. NPDC101157 TaxID=3364098 RepID=UPI0038157A60